MKNYILKIIFFAIIISCNKEDSVNNLYTKVLAKNPSDISYFEAVIEGEILHSNEGEIYDCGFVWSKNPSPTKENSNHFYFGSKSTPVQLNLKITELEPNTDYYYKLFIIVKSGIVYSNEIKLTTLSSPWKQLQNFRGIGRQNAITFSINGKGYVCNGNGDNGNQYKDVWEFDPSDNEWIQKSDFPGNDLAAATGFVIGNKGYIATGLCNCEEVWEYDPSIDKWTQKNDFPENNIFYATSFVIENKGYVGTGIKNGYHLKDFWEYDPQSDTWTRKAYFPDIAVDCAAGFSIQNKGYIATGNPSIGVSQSLWQYDPLGDNWQRKADFPYTTFGAVGFSINNKGFVGFGNSGESRFYQYNPELDTWMKIVDFPGRNREGACVFVINNIAYIGLGTPSWTDYPVDFWEFSTN